MATRRTIQCVIFRYGIVGGGRVARARAQRRRLSFERKSLLT